MTSTPGTLTVTLVDGTQVVVPDSLEQMTSYVLQEQGDWFEDEIKFLRRLVQPGQTVVDIGANVGVYALCLARKVGPSGQVWAFEPASTTADLLDQSIAVNGTPWLNLQRQALSDHTRTAWLQTPGQSELNSLAPTPDGEIASQQGPGEEVPLTTLDACLETFAWQQVDLLKIDAEGEEERILAGGRRFFAELSPLVMFELKAGTELHLELVERFQALGYSCYRLVPGLDVLMPFDPADGVDGYLLNLFAAKPDRADVLAAEGWLVPTASPEQPQGAELTPYHWRRVLENLPMGRSIGPRWAEVDTEPFRTAASLVALWGFAHDPGQPVDRRLGALQHAHQLLQQTAIPNYSLPLWATRVRLAWEMGFRQQALQATGHLLPAFAEAAEPDLKEPFLPPGPSFDPIDPAGRPAAWLEAAALENEELLRAFSSFFDSGGAFPRLERICALGYETPLTRRRLAVLRRRFPEQARPDPSMERANPEQTAVSRLAWTRAQQRDYSGAHEALGQALAMGDCCSQALLYMGRTLLAIGEGEQGITMLQRAVDLNPENVVALLELGQALILQGKVEAGQAVAQQCVFLYAFLLGSREPTAADLSNLAIAHDLLDQSDESLACLNRALELKPNLENALRRKASILSRSKDGHEQALAIWQHLLIKNPEDVAVLVHCASLLQLFGEIQEARTLLEQALVADPNNLMTYLPLAWNTSISGEAAMHDHLKFLQDYWQKLRAAEQQESLIPAVSYSLPAATDKLRVAVLSAEVGTHVVGLFLEPFFSNYNKDLLELEIIQVREQDGPFASHLRSKADAVLSVKGLTTAAARQRIRSRGYHLIVETSGFTTNTAIGLLAQRCAPVQCHYIGSHASTGLDTIDWFIGDQITAAPELSCQFVEKLWRLPRPWLASYRMPILPPAASLVSENAPVLGSFNQLAKVRRETLEFWACALRRLPEATLQIKSFTTSAQAPRQRILADLEALGVDSARVSFLAATPTSRDNLEKYRHIDLALDTTPWSSATTGFDALIMGVPLIGIHGDCTASRMSSSILHAIGHDDWVARTPEDFADAVERQCSNLDGLRAGREQLRQRVLDSSLFDGADLARHLEQAFRTMVNQPERVRGSQKLFS